MRFHDYLLAMTGRTDSVGDLARDYADGIATGAHGSAGSLDDMAAILRRFSAPPAAFDALDELRSQR